MIRLLSYNIHGCVGRRGVSNPAAILKVIQSTDADVVALQEVYDENQTDRSFLKSLHRLDYADVIYGPTMRKPEGRYGNVILSRNPVAKCEQIDISVTGREPRGAIRIWIDSNGIEYEVTGTHLGLSASERVKQISHLANRLSFGGEPTRRQIKILAGDFNEWLPFSRGNLLLRNKFGKPHTLKTFPARLPFLSLDRVYVCPWRTPVKISVRRSEMETNASDHLPVIAEIEGGE